MLDHVSAGDRIAGAAPEPADGANLLNLLNSAGAEAFRLRERRCRLQVPPQSRAKCGLANGRAGAIMATKHNASTCFKMVRSTPAMSGFRNSRPYSQHPIPPCGQMPSVSIIIPVYRAEQTLLELYRQLSATMVEITSVFEILFIEDGGGDQSWPIICRLARADHRVRGIRMSRNYGQHNALLCGIREARYDVVLTMDDDLQHPVSEIRPMLAALRPEYDVVYGAPETEQHGFLRNIASRLTKVALASAMGAETARNVSAFRAFRTRLRDGFQAYRGPSVSIDVLLTWTTTRFTAIKVRHVPRAAGVSGYTMSKLIRHAVDLMTGFSTLPLQIASVIGFIFVMFGASTVILVFINYLLRGSAVPGFTFLASLVAIFSGAQLFALGVIGEYLARMHFRSMDRPTYVIGERAAPSDGDAAAGPVVQHAIGTASVV
jgi:glycosyltransferase involved in cell wall biosynthesis